MPGEGPGPGAPAPLPLVGVAPPPIGPRLPDPQALTDLRQGIEKLLDAAEKDPLVGKEINPIIEKLMGASKKLRQPPKPSREEAAAGFGGPLDQTPPGDVAGIPLPTMLPRLAGLGQR